MHHLPIVRPLAALVAACLLANPLAWSQTPTPAPSAGSSAAPKGAAAVAPASTPEALSAELVGKTFFLRDFYQDEKLQFATDGKAIGNPQKGSFALSAVEIDKVHFTKHSVELEAHRVGLHFFGALPYEDDTKPFERIKVDPKKSMDIEIERLVIEPEKKKKKKDKDKDDRDGAAKLAKAPTPNAAAVQTAALPAAPDATSDDAAPAADAAVVKAPAASGTATPTGTAATATAAPAIAPNHDPRVSFLELSKAINVIFAPTLDDSVIATLPEYWQNYFATKAGKARTARLDATAMRPGGDVKPPQLLTVLDPASNDYAQKNNIAGMVFLRMVVDAQGRPGEVTIVRPIGFGLDEKAVEAVRHSVFRAGTFNGKPVSEVVNLQVTFRIYSNRTRPNGTQPSTPPTQVAPKESPKMPPSNAPVVAAATVSE
jgi:TonB family protein